MTKFQRFWHSVYAQTDKKLLILCTGWEVFNFFFNYTLNCVNKRTLVFIIIINIYEFLERN